MFCHPTIHRIEAQSGISIDERNVRFWPKADIRGCTAHVRFRG
jgi:hypothetical protein